jgi:cbb3-type cytochrome oxidase subunit 3
MTNFIIDGILFIPSIVKIFSSFNWFHWFIYTFLVCYISFISYQYRKSEKEINDLKSKLSFDENKLEMDFKEAFQNALIKTKTAGIYNQYAYDQAKNAYSIIIEQILFKKDYKKSVIQNAINKYLDEHIRLFVPLT